MHTNRPKRRAAALGAMALAVGSAIAAGPAFAQTPQIDPDKLRDRKVQPLPRKPDLRRVDPKVLPLPADRLRQLAVLNGFGEMYDPTRSGPIYSVEYRLAGSGDTVDIRYEVIDGLAIAEGDIILGRHADMVRAEEQRRRCDGEVCTVQSPLIRRAGENYLWPGGVIPYTIDSDFTAAERLEIETAIGWVDGDTNLILKERDGERDYVEFQKVDRGCSADVGRQEGRQGVRLSPGCSTGNAAHEILHAAGAWHEQSRSDRARFVRINWDNIESDKKPNFDMHDTDGVDIGEYDYGSIMHYPRRAFGKPDPETGVDMVTIEPLEEGVVIGQRVGLSDRDIAGINEMYAGEDCVYFNPATTRAARRDGRWKLVDGDNWLKDFGGNEAEAREAAAVVRHYSLDQLCFVGRPDASLEYFLTDGELPSGARAGEDCLSFPAQDAEIRQIDGKWTIVYPVRGRMASARNFPNAGEAYKSLDLLQQNAARRQCFVGRPDPSMVYFRR